MCLYGTSHLFLQAFLIVCKFDLTLLFFLISLVELLRTLHYLPCCSTCNSGYLGAIHPFIMMLVHTFGCYILVPHPFMRRSCTRLATTFSFTIRLRDARTYDCYRIFTFIITVCMTLVHTVFQLVWGSLRFAPINMFAYFEKEVQLFTYRLPCNKTQDSFQSWLNQAMKLTLSSILPVLLIQQYTITSEVLLNLLLSNLPFILILRTSANSDISRANVFNQ